MKRGIWILALSVLSLFFFSCSSADDTQTSNDDGFTSSSSTSSSSSSGGADDCDETISTGYYTGINTCETGNTFKQSLHDLIDNHTQLTYSEVWEALKDLDEDPDNSSNVILIYSRISRSKDLNGGDTGDWNREHSWPKSHGFPDESDVPYTDVHHLRASDVQANGSRSNKGFDDGGSLVINCTSAYTDSDSFEPPDIVKGDLARAMFYMSVRYEGDSGEPDLELVNYDTTSTSSPVMNQLSTLLEWHNQDPVDDTERARNEKVYLNWQHNRNPFVDHPEWVEKVFE